MAETTDYELTVLIKRLAALLHQNIDLWLKPYDLARTQYAVLHALHERGSLPTGELLLKLQVEAATLSGLVDTLETKGLVERVEQAADKRRKDVRLTAAGRKLLAAIPAPGPAMERVMLHGVEHEQVELTKLVARQMLANLETELGKQESAV